MKSYSGCLLTRKCIITIVFIFKRLMQLEKALKYIKMTFKARSKTCFFFKVDKKINGGTFIAHFAIVLQMMLFSLIHFLGH